MGYLTCFDFELLEGSEDKFQDFLKELSIESKYSEIKNGYLYDAKWYDWERDLIQVSSEFPEVFITVDGDGEESDDIWRAFIKDGAIQFAAARIVYDEYDPAKMQQVLPPRLKKQTDVEDLI